MLIRVFHFFVHHVHGWAALGNDVGKYSNKLSEKLKILLTQGICISRKDIIPASVMMDALASKLDVTSETDLILAAVPF